MPNPFKPNDIVKTIAATIYGAQRVGGVVKYVACRAATIAGGKTCDKKLCPHSPKEMIWVKWATTIALMTYHYNELAHDQTTAASTTTSAPPIDPTPTVNITDNPKETDEQYIERTKDAIKEALKQKDKPIDDFWGKYNGFDKLRYDRNGRQYIQRTEQEPKQPIENDQIDWENYTGRSRGPARKVGL